MKHFKFLKILTVVIMLGLVLTTLAGCKKRPSNEEFIANGIKLYEQEFDDEFSFVREVRDANGTWGEFGTLEEGKKEIVVTSKKYPNKEINMSFWYNTSTKKYRKCGSNYNFVRYEEQLYKDLEKVTQIYLDSFIHISTDGLDNNNLNYTEYTNTIENHLNLDVYVAPGQYNKDEDLEKIISILKENNIKVRSLEITYFNNSEEYNRIKAIENKDEPLDLNSRTYKRIHVVLDENYNITYTSEFPT